MFFKSYGWNCHLVHVLKICRKEPTLWKGKVAGMTFHLKFRELWIIFENSKIYWKQIKLGT